MKLKRVEGSGFFVFCFGFVLFLVVFLCPVLFNFFDQSEWKRLKKDWNGWGGVAVAFLDQCRAVCSWSRTVSLE